MLVMEPRGNDNEYGYRNAPPSQVYIPKEEDEDSYL